MRLYPRPPRLLPGVCALFCACVAFASAAVVTWNGAAGTTAFTDAGNWDANAVPGPNDHVNIGGSTTQVDLNTPISVGSFRVYDGASFVVESSLNFATGVSVEPTSSLTLLNAQLLTSTQPTLTASTTTPTPSKVYPTVTVAGRLSLLASQIKGAEPLSVSLPPTLGTSTAASSAGVGAAVGTAVLTPTLVSGGSVGVSSSDNEPTMILSVPVGGIVTVTGTGTNSNGNTASAAASSNVSFTRVRANIAGVFTVTSSNPLDLSYSHLLVQSAGLLTVTNGGAGINKLAVSTPLPADTTTKVEVLGTMTCDASLRSPSAGTNTVTLTLSAPLDLAMSGRLNFLAAADRTAFFRLTAPLTADGTVTLSNNAQLVLATPNANTAMTSSSTSSGTSTGTNTITSTSTTSTGTAVPALPALVTPPGPTATAVGATTAAKSPSTVTVFSSTSALTVPNGAAVYAESGRVEFFGTVNSVASPTGSLVLRTGATVAGTAALAEVFMLAGAALKLGSTEDDAALNAAASSSSASVSPSPSATAGRSSEVHIASQLYWESGTITGVSRTSNANAANTASTASGAASSVVTANSSLRRIVTGPAASFTVANTQANTSSRNADGNSGSVNSANVASVSTLSEPTLVGATVVLNSANALVARGAALSLGEGGVIEVTPGAMLTVAAGSAVKPLITGSSNSNAVGYISVYPTGVIKADLSGNAGDPAIIGVEVKPQDGAVGAGTGATVLIAGPAVGSVIPMGRQHELVFSSGGIVAIAALAVQPADSNVVITITGSGNSNSNSAANGASAVVSSTDLGVTFPVEPIGTGGTSIAVTSHGHLLLPALSVMTLRSLSLGATSRVSLGRDALLTVADTLVLGAGASTFSSSIGSSTINGSGSGNGVGSAAVTNSAGAASAVVEGDATIRARAVVLLQGTLKPATLIVGSGGIDIRSDNAEVGGETALVSGATLMSTLATATATSPSATAAATAAAASGAGSTTAAATTASKRAIGASALRLDDGGVLSLAHGTDVDVTNVNAIWHLSPGTGALIGPGASLRAATPRLSGSPSQITPQLWLEQAVLAFTSPPDSDSSSTGLSSSSSASGSPLLGLAQQEHEGPGRLALHVRNSGGSISVRANAQALLAAGVASQDRYGSPSTDTRVVLGNANSVLTVKAPTPVAAGLGLVTGPGLLVLSGGEQRLSRAPEGGARVVTTAGAETEIGAAAVSSVITASTANGGNGGTGWFDVPGFDGPGTALAATNTDGIDFAIIPGLNDGATPPVRPGTTSAGTAADGAPLVTTTPTTTPGMTNPATTVTGTEAVSPISANRDSQPFTIEREPTVMGSNARKLAWGLFGATLALAAAVVALAAALLVQRKKYGDELAAVKKGVAQPSVLMGSLARSGSLGGGGGGLGGPHGGGSGGGLLIGSNNIVPGAGAGAAGASAGASAAVPEVGSPLNNNAGQVLSPRKGARAANAR